MFWGLVVGDCLGSPIQFTSKDDHPYITEMVPCPVFRTPPGYWTDDSSLAFCVAESFVRLGGRYDLEDVAKNFARWLDDGFWSSLPEAFDVGGATASAIRRFQATGSLVNGTEDRQGNGSVMRLAPSYIVNLGAPDATIIREISDLTHSSEAVRGAVAKMAAILDDLLAGRAPSVRSPYKTRAEVNNSGWAVSTVDAALWALENSSTFEEGAILAVNLGGDADTIGAVFGQFGGAKYGFSAIPERWLAAIKDREKIDDLIEELLALKGFSE